MTDDTKTAEELAAEKAAEEKAAAEKKAAEDKEKGKKNEVTDSPEFKKVVSESMKRKERLKEMGTELDETNKSLTETKTKLQEFETKFEGIDPEQVRQMLEDSKAADRKKMESKGEYDRILAQVNTEHETTLTKLQTDFEATEKDLKARIAKLSGVNEGLTIGRAFSDSEFVRDELTLTPTKARQVYGSHFEVNEDGAVVAYDKPAGSSERTMIVDGKGAPAPFSDAITKIVEADAECDQIMRSKLKAGAESKTERKMQEAKKVEKKGVQRIQAGLGELDTSGIT